MKAATIIHLHSTGHYSAPVLFSMPYLDEAEKPITTTKITKRKNNTPFTHIFRTISRISAEWCFYIMH